jgi:hypothetical protein
MRSVFSFPDGRDVEFSECVFGRLLERPEEPSRAMLDAADRVQRASLEAEHKAVSAWAAQANVTPEQWLKVFRPVAKVTFTDTAVHVSVTAALRD